MSNPEAASIWPETLPFLRLLEQHLGFALGEEKQYLVASRLQPIAREHGLSDWRALVRQLLQQPVGALHWTCFEAMTTQETRFFRDGFCFDTLREQVLPELIASARSRRTLSLWSAGTSTGQEACSLAMLLHNDFPEVRGWQVRIWATDICQDTLAQAQAMAYTQQELDNGLDAAQQARYFELQPDGRRQLVPELRRWIQVARHNLLLPVPQTGFDLVMLRNVLIYFRAEQKLQVLRHVRQSMTAPAGVLVLGASESLFQDELFIAHKAARGRYFTRTPHLS